MQQPDREVGGTDAHRQIRTLQPRPALLLLCSEHPAPPQPESLDQEAGGRPSRGIQCLGLSENLQWNIKQLGRLLFGFCEQAVELIPDLNEPA